MKRYAENFTSYEESFLQYVSEHLNDDTQNN